MVVWAQDLGFGGLGFRGLGFRVWASGIWGLGFSLTLVDLYVCMSAGGWSFTAGLGLILLGLRV